METKRGRILRDTAAGPGLVFVNGTQFVFPLEGAWRSERAPQIDMLVDVDFDELGHLVALRAVDDFQGDPARPAGAVPPPGVNSLQLGRAGTDSRPGVILEYGLSVDRFTALGKTYTLGWSTGTVLAVTSKVATLVFGGREVPVSSSTVTHDDIFLRLADGREVGHRLVGFELPMRADHVLTVVWASDRLKQVWWYVVVRDHTTGQTFFQDHALREIFYGSETHASFINFMLSFLLTCMTFGLYVIVLLGRVRRRRRLADARIREFKASVSFFPRPDGK